MVDAGGKFSWAPNAAVTCWAWWNVETSKQHKVLAFLIFYAYKSSFNELTEIPGYKQQFSDVKI